MLTLGLEEKPFSSMHQSTISDLTWELLPLRDELFPAHSFSLISASLTLNKPFTLPVSSPSSELCLFPGPDKSNSEPENELLERVLDFWRISVGLVEFYPPNAWFLSSWCRLLLAGSKLRMSSGTPGKTSWKWVVNRQSAPESSLCCCCSGKTGGFFQYFTGS